MSRKKGRKLIFLQYCAGSNASSRFVWPTLERHIKWLTELVNLCQNLYNHYNWGQSHEEYLHASELDVHVNLAKYSETNLQIASSMYLAGYSRHLQPSSNVWLRARCAKCIVEQQKKSKLWWVAHVLPSECCDGAEVSCNFRCIQSIWSHANRELATT